MNDIKTITEFPRKTREIADMRIPMPDGSYLSARVWMPVDAETNPVPAILEHLPYRKRDGTAVRDALTHPYFAGHGYACIRVDMRGNGDSPGVMEDEYSEQELADAEAVIAWVAAQPWCSGSLGMMGISWGGFNALQVAARAPEPLKAVVSLCSTVDRFADDIHYKGGCLLNENLGWAGTMLSYSSRPPDPAIVGENWRDMWLERLNNQANLAEVWLSHQRRDAYWQHGSVCEDYSAIKAKVLAIGGWGDAYKNAVPQLVENLPGAKGIIGPWVHKYPHFAVPGPRIGFLQEALRWWDRWLKGIETGVEDDPDLRLYQMDSVRPKSWYLHRDGRWLGCNSDALAHNTEFHLSRGGKLTTAPEDIVVPLTSPQDVGAEGGEYCAIWLGPELPGDQRRDDVLSICFDSEVLGEALGIIGAPQLRLRLSSSQNHGQIAVRLCEVFPDGASTRLSYAVLNLTHRTNAAAPVSVDLDTPFEVTINLDHMACTLAKGNRLRVAISSAYWPLIWPGPGAQEHNILGGLISFSHIDTRATSTVSMPTPEAASPWQHRVVRESAHERRRSTDMATGIVTLDIVDDFGAAEDAEHGLIAGSIAREAWSIHPEDPLSAKGSTHWTQTMERGPWSIRTEARQQMWSDAEWFYQTAEVEAFEGDSRIFHREFSAKIKRDHL